jgi:two-component system, OmpR family, sensor histidine kinase BaeS
MTFRARVLALVALVAVTAIGVTAWVTLQQASRQVTQSAAAEREDVELITDEVTDYGLTHGTWEGVTAIVDQLEVRTGQRIRLTAESGVVVVDTDQLAGVAARPVGSPPISINARPSLELSPDLETEPELIQATLVEIDSYRSGVLFAACLTRRQIPVTAVEGSNGVPRYLPAATPDFAGAVAECTRVAAVDDALRELDVAEVSQCSDLTVRAITPAWRNPDPLPDPDLLARDAALFDRFAAVPVPPAPKLSTTAREVLARCLAETFAIRTGQDGFAPQALLVYIGAEAEEPALSPGPILAAAALIAALAVAGSLLVSRRVVRPIRALTGASYRLGKGDLSERVPVVGRDELAALAQSFNRMADSLQRGEERQRRLVADVAHELRTPLANLRGYLEALKDGVISPGPEVFTSLHEEAVLQQRIVDDLQDLALAEAGTLVYHRSQVDLAELLEVCRTAHQAVAEAAGVRLAVSGDEPGYVHADPDRLRQVLGNLVGNALRATPSGGSITLAARQEGGYAVITVTDTGTGIQREHLPHVFDRFWRADAARDRASGGSGLGLAIARQLVTDHGGTIQVESEHGAGTTFTIRLPSLVPP